jgi:hypothetical protein
MIFFLAVIVVSPMDFTALALNARSGDTCGGPGWIGNLFESGANGIVHNSEAFGLRTHREHIGGLARQVEQSIAHAQEALLKATLDGVKLCNLACLDGVLALLAATFRGHKTRALLRKLITRRASATGSDRAQVRKNLATHLVEIIFSGRLPGDHAFRKVLIELRP